MSQSWGPPPGYPPPRPPQPQYQLAVPEPDYYPIGDPPIRRALYFIGGSCSTLILVSFCVCALAVFWIIDERIGLTGGQTAAENLPPTAVATVPVVENPPPAQPVAPAQPPPTATPSPPPDPTANEAAPIGQPVVAQDVNAELTVFDIQRNVQPVNLQVPDGTEFIAVSIQLRNLQADTAQSFTIANFTIVDGENTVFTPNPDADNGRRLQDGQISPSGVQEGDLLFHVPLGHTPLTLAWQAQGSAQVFQIKLQ